MSKNTRTIVIVAVVAVLCLCCCTAVAVALATRLSWSSRLLQGGSVGLARNVESSSEVSQQFDVGSSPTIVVNNEVGSITVSAGTTGVVSVLAEVRARAATESEASALVSETRFDASGDSDRVTVTVDVPDAGRGGSVEVTLTITVPAGSTLDVHTLVGDVAVKGTRGEAELGANVGNLEWVGALPESGSVTLTTSVGNVSFEAPAESAFHLDAATSSGRVNSALALANGDDDENLLGDSAAGDYGADPRVTVALRTDVGNVDVSVR
jgi:hypothetical protein